MKKQEAIEKIKNIDTLNINDKAAGQRVDMVIKNQVLGIVSQIEEPQKPVVPKFVCEWVDDSREYRFGFDEWFDCNNQPKKVQLWLNSENKRQEELNALALVTLIVNGANAVEIEQEKLYTVGIKLYTVEIPDLHGLYKIGYLYRNAIGEILIGETDYREIFLNEDTHLTESEIKQDFEWAWDAGFAKPVEVE